MVTETSNIEDILTEIKMKIHQKSKKKKQLLRKNKRGKIIDFETPFP
jgi:hypothetical protein